MFYESYNLNVQFKNLIYHNDLIFIRENLSIFWFIWKPL